MTTGTTQLVVADTDDTASVLTNIGFGFVMQGNYFTKFSANSNGIVQLGSTVIATNAYTASGGSATSPKISPYGADLKTGASGKVHFKLVGTAPNRCMVIEFSNMSLVYVATPGSNDGTFQVRLYETSGIIQFVYGSMFRNASTTNSGGFVNVGFSSGILINNTASITTSIHSVSNAATFNTNSHTASTTITDLNSTANGSRRAYVFTPSTATPTGPTALTLGTITTTNMVLNWTAASSVVGTVRYIVLNSTDNVNFNFVANVATGTNTFTALNLTPATQYYWKVVAVTEGKESIAATNSATTLAGTTYYWVGATGGLWSAAANWNTAANGTGTTRVTAATTDILIVDGAGTTAGAATTISVDAVAQTIGQFQVISNTACTLIGGGTANKVVTILGGPGNDFVIANGSSLNLTGAGTTPNWAVAFAFSTTTTGNTGDISGTYNSAGAVGNNITTTGGTGTVVTVSATGVVNNSILGSSGCLTGNAATLSFANGSNYTHSAYTTLNAYIPTATWGATSTATLTGGTTGSGLTSGSTSLGNLTINSTTLTTTLSAFTTTAVVIQGNLNVLATGSGTFRTNTASPGTTTVNGNVSVSGTAKLSLSNAATSGAILKVLGNTTIDGTATLNLDGGTYTQSGASFTNNSILTGTVTGSRLSFSLATVAQTFAGTGTILTNLDGVSFSNPLGVTITHSNQIPTLRVNLFQGTVINSNKLSMGTGAALAVTTQIGSTGSLNPGGNFDVSPTWNLGTGIYNLNYQQESVSRTTGFEVSPARIIGTLTVANSNGLTLSGGALSTTTLTFSALSGGNITTTDTNLLTVTGTLPSNIVRTLATAYVNGPLALTLPASLPTGSVYVFPVGKSTDGLRAFELVNPTTTAGGTVVVKAETFQGASGGSPSAVSPTMSIINNNRYWAASITSGSANFTNSNIRLNDNAAGFSSNTAAATAEAVANSLTSGTATYNIVGGAPHVTVANTSITSAAPSATTISGFYAMGLLAPQVTSANSSSYCANVSSFTITGTNLLGVTAVSINGVAVTSFVVVNATTITGVVGAAVTGKMQVTKSGLVFEGGSDVIVDPSPAAPSVSASAVTINIGALVNVTASSGTGGTYKWYDAATNGTLLYTGAAFNQAVCSGNIWVSETGSGCEGPRAMVTIVRNPTTIVASNTTFCGTGGVVTLTANPVDPNITYTWTSLTAGVSLTALTGGSVSTTAAIAATSDFQVVASQNGCTSAPIITSIGVYPLPNANLVAPAGGCQGAPFTIASGLVADFSSNTISAAPLTAPGSAVTLVNAGVVNVALTSGTLDDGGWGAIPIGFSYNFFGTIYNTLNVGTNGNVMFGAYSSAGLGDFSFITLPSNTEPLGMVAVLAIDNNLNGADGGRIRYWTEGYAPNRKFVISYEAVKEHLDTKYSTAQAVFYETTGLIDVFVTSSTNVDRVKIIGVNSPDGTKGTLAYKSGTVASTTPQNPITTALSYKFTPPANYTVSWLQNTTDNTTVGAAAGDTPVLVGGVAQTNLTNAFSVLVSPSVTTTYKIKYTNQTTGCTNTISTTPNSASQTTAVIYDTVAPSGVAALSTLPSICVGNSITLSTDYDVVATPSNANGLFYQWQSSPIGANTFTDIALATAATYVTTPTAGLDYRMKFKRCTGAETFSSLVSVPFTNNILTTTGGTRCGTGTATVSATFAGAAGVVVNWYSAATGGTLLGTGSPFTTASISADTTFYATAETTGPACSSPRVGALVTVTAPPALAASANQTICNDAVGLLEVTPATLANYHGYTWSPITNLYTDAAGTVAYTAGTNASTVYVRGTTAAIITYTVTGTNSVAPYCLSSAASVVTIMPNPTISGSVICISGTTTLSLSNTTVAAYGAGTIQWSQAPTLGGVYTDIPNANGVTYTTNNLSAESYFKATLTSPSGACSVAPLFTVLINNPTITSVSGATNCGTAAMTLSAAGTGLANYNWYSAATGGTLLQSSASNTYATPTLATTTNYYVAAVASPQTGTNLGENSNAVPNGTLVSAERGIVFTATNNGTIVSAQYYSAATTVTNTVTVKLVDDATGTQVGSSLILPIVQGATAGWYTMNLNLAVTAGTTYRLLAAFSSAVNRISSGADYSSAVYTNMFPLGTIISGYDSGASTTTYNYFHNISVSVPCESARSQVTATVTPAPDVVLSAVTNATQVCTGTPTTLVTIASVTNGTVGSFNSYLWSPTTGVIGDAVNGWTFSNYANTVYTLTASSVDGSGNPVPGTCTDLSTFSLVLAPSPTVVDVTNTNATVCMNNLQAVTATGGNILNNSLLSESFDSGIGSFTFSAGSTTTDMDWTPKANGFVYGTNIFSGSTNGFMLANSDLGGSSSTLANTILVSPSFSTMSHSGITLSFKEYLNNPTDIAAAVEISSDNFVTSTILRNNLTTDIGSLSTFNNTVIAIPAAFENLPSVKIRFRYEGTYDWYWAVDEVNVKGTYNLLNWSATNAILFTDAAGTIPYIAPGLYPTTIYVRPTAANNTAVIAATATLGSCSKSDTVSYTTLSSNFQPTTGWDVAPAANRSIVFNDNYSIAGDIAGCDCTVSAGKVVTIPTGSTVLLENGLTNNGILIFESGSSLLQTNKSATNTGNITYKRTTATLAKNLDTVYWGSPVVGQPLAGMWMTSMNDTFYTFNPSTATAADPLLGWNYASPNTSMTPGVGYISRAVDGQGNPVWTPGNSWTSSFIGIPFNGDKTFTVVKAANSIDNLMANPYPSALDLEALTDDSDNSTKVTGNFYFWIHKTEIASNIYTSNDFGVFNVTLGAGVGTGGALSSGLTPTRYVPAAQGFFAEASSTGGVVTFKNTHRVSGNNSTFYRAASTRVPSEKLWLNITNTQGLFKQLMLSYVNQATTGFDDRLDARSFDGNSYIDFYSVIPNHKLAIQSKPLPFDSSDIVPLGYSTSVLGTMKIAIDHADAAFTGRTVYLQDYDLGIVHNLTAGDYTFTTAAGTFDSRFLLKYTSALGTNDNDILDNTVIVAKDKNVLKVRSSIEDIKSITIFDILGRKVYAKDAINNKAFSEVDVVKNDQTLIVKITLTNGAVVTKKIIY